MHNKKIAFGDNLNAVFEWLYLPLIGSGKYSLSGLGKCFTCAPQEHTFLHHKKGLTLLEIITATVILSLVMTGMANVFLASKRHILHSRSRMTGGELGKLFLEPLQMQVRQDQWGNNCLSNPANCCSNPADCQAGTTQGLDRNYTAQYTIQNDQPIANVNRVRVNITWQEPPP